MAGARKKANKRNGNYQGYYIDHTGRRVFFTGTPSRQETKQIAQQLESEHRQIALGVKPAPTAPARHRKRPFLEVVDEHIAWGLTFGRKDGKPWARQHADCKASYLRKWAETLSIETLADLDGILPRVEATLRQLAEQGFGGRTLAARAKSLTSLCHWCIGHGYLRDDPLKGLPKIDETPETERRALTTDEIAKLFSVAPAWCQLLYATALTSGLRICELRRLDRAELDVPNGRLCLPWRKTKNRKAAYCYLPAKLITQLAAFADSGEPKRLYESKAPRIRKALPESPLLFVPSHAVRLLYKDLEKVGIPKATAEGKLDFHALRVASITLASEQGATPKELQEHARHSDPRLTFGIYAKARDNRRAELAERIGGVIPDVKSATEVHFEGETLSPDAHKSLPEQDLAVVPKDRGPCRAGMGLGSLLPRSAVGPGAARSCVSGSGNDRYGFVTWMSSM